MFLGKTRVVDERIQMFDKQKDCVSNISCVVMDGDQEVARFDQFVLTGFTPVSDTQLFGRAMAKCGPKEMLAAIRLVLQAAASLANNNRDSLGDLYKAAIVAELIQGVENLN